MNESQSVFLLVLGQHLLHLEVQSAEGGKQGQHQRNNRDNLQSVSHRVRHQVLHPPEVVAVVDTDHAEDKGDNAQDVVEGLLVDGPYPLRQLLVVQIGHTVNDGDAQEDYGHEPQHLVHVVQVPSSRASLVLEPNADNGEDPADDLQQPMQKDLRPPRHQVTPDISRGQRDDSLGHQQLVLEWVGC